MLSDGERGAAEMAILGDSPPRFIESDVYSANALAGIICRTDASRSAFIEHCYQEAQAIIEENKAVVLALAQALIDHHELTLNAAEIDAVIARRLHARRSPLSKPAAPHGGRSPSALRRSPRNRDRATWMQVARGSSRQTGLGQHCHFRNWG
jgi:hypothetical protein